MKKLITIAFLLFISVAAFPQAQTLQQVDSLKIPANQAAKIESIDKQLKELEPARQQINTLEAIKTQLIEAAFEYSGKPVPKDKVYQKGVILFIKDTTVVKQ